MPCVKVLPPLYFHYRKSAVGCFPPPLPIRRLGCFPAAHAPRRLFLQGDAHMAVQADFCGDRHLRSGCFWARRVKPGCFRRLREHGASRLLLLVPNAGDDELLFSDAPRAKSGADLIRPFFVSSARSRPCSRASPHLSPINPHQPSSTFVNLHQPLNVWHRLPLEMRQVVYSSVRMLMRGELCE